MKYKTGDILVSKDTGAKRKVLGVCDFVVFISLNDSFERIGDSYCEQQIDELFTLKPSEWKPESSDHYYFIMDNGEVDYSYWSDEDDYDKFRLATKNCFLTREEAEARLSEIKKGAGLI